MDGTVYLGNHPIVGAVRFITNYWKNFDFYFLSNNTSKSLTTYVDKLNNMGIPATLDVLLSPARPLVNFLRKTHCTNIYLVANRDFSRELHEYMPELRETAEEAEAVVLAYDTELTYEKLARSALILQRKEVRFLATHPDLVCPSPEGPLPDVGSMLALYETATGRRPEHIFGKPDPMVLAPLLERYDKKDMVMVGDRLSTDKKLAENAGIDFVLVLSGEARLEDLASEERKPWRVFEDLGKAEAELV